MSTPDPSRPSAWTVRQKLDELLDAEFEAFKASRGCHVGDNYKAAIAILEAIQFLKQSGGDGDDGE